MASFPMMSSTPHLNFRNDLMMINGGGGQLRFPGMFNGGMLESTNLDANGAKPRLPIWLDQHGNETHLENPSNSSFLGPSSSNNVNNNGGLLPSEMVQWLNGSQENMATTYNSGLHLKEEENKGEMHFNSLYNNNNYTTTTTTPPPPPPPAHMSATALLQKAAQMGSTRSTNGGGANEGFGLMTTTNLSNFSTSNHNNNGDGLMMMMMTSSGSKQSKGNESSHDGNLTRDFLGVGGNERRPFDLQQELFNFSSSMEN